MDDWYTDHVQHLLVHGHDIAPRGEPAREVLNRTIVIDDFNVIDSPVRKVNLRFMVAEWLWMWFGRNDVATLAQYNPNMRRYSDDGVTLAGAYGPRFRSQVDGLIAKLRSDNDTRQAVVSIWYPTELCRLNSKDYPCTLTWQFFIRSGQLHMTANMRSSDAWLGVPYDVYSFSMVLRCMAAELRVKPGTMTLNMGSAHIYERDWLPALRMLPGPTRYIASPSLPSAPPPWLENVLVARTYHGVGMDDGVWGNYARALTAPSQVNIVSILRGMVH